MLTSRSAALTVRLRSDGIDCLTNISPLTSMSKALIFISHITAEKEIAIALQSLIEKGFIGMVDVFVSSDENSIRLGEKWLDRITDALKKCCIEIILCSSQSVSRPWINFEAGSGWIREIAVIPLCHSGMKPDDLPLPLNLIQGAEANQVSSLNRIFSLIAKAIGSNTPPTDFAPFIDEVVKFEERYSYWDAINDAFAKIEKAVPGVVSALNDQQFFIEQVGEIDLHSVSSQIELLKKHGILGMERRGVGMHPRKGSVISCRFMAGAKFAETLTNANFKR